MNSKDFDLLAEQELELFKNKFSFEDTSYSSEFFNACCNAAFGHPQISTLRNVMVMCEGIGLYYNVSCLAEANKTFLSRKEHYDNNGDRLENFKKTDEPYMSDNPLENLKGFVSKHLKWVSNLLKGQIKNPTQTQILEHVGDVFNYAILAIALLREKNNE